MKSEQINVLRRTTLRQRLILTLAAALTPILLIGAFESYVNARQAVEGRRLELISLGDDAVDDLEQALITAESFLNVFAPVIAQSRCQDIRDDVSEVLPVLANVSHFNARGISECTTASENPVQISNLDWLDELRGGKDMIRTDAFYGAVSETYLFAILKRLNTEDGEFNGLASFSMRADSLATLLNVNQVDPNLDIAISDGDGRVFGSSEFGNIPAEWFDQINNGSSTQLFTHQGQDGKERDVVLTKVATDGVYVVVSRPSPGLQSQFTLSPISGLGLPLLAFSIALVAVWFSVDRLVLKWLTRLKRIAKIYGAGKYNLRTAHHFAPAPEEFAEFAETMDDMAQKVDQRDASLRDAITKRDQAVKEIHHRVKNNLQIVTSFLSLQSRAMKDEGAKAALASAQHRIDALSIVHQTLYQHERLDSVELKPFLEGLLRHLSLALGMEDSDVDISWDLESIIRRSDDAIPIALFIVEAVTNSMKYAFDLDGGKITITLKRGDGEIILHICDDGLGPSESSQGTGAETRVEIQKKNGGGLGSKLMTAFARQLKAEYSARRVEGVGYCIDMHIPHSEKDERDPEPLNY